MRTIAHRELRNESSKVLAEVKAGQTIAVTNNGEVAAILVPPGSSRLDQMIASGRVEPAKNRGMPRPIPKVKSDLRIADVLDELRGER